jgi:hypothetical protein
VSISAARQPVPIGGELTLSTSASEALGEFSVSFFEQPATQVTGDDTVWEASYILGEDDPHGLTAFIVAFSDLGLNAGEDVVATTDGSTVQVDTTRPFTTSVVMSSSTTTPVGFGGEVMVSFTSSEPLGTGIITWMQNSPVETVCDTMRTSCTASYPVADDDDDGVVPFSIFIVDAVGNAGEGLVTELSEGLPVEIDLTPPALTVTIDTAGGSPVGASRLVVLRFNSTEPLDTSSFIVILANSGVEVSCDDSGIACSATHMLSEDTPNGLITFSIVYSDIAQNRGPLVIETTDGSFLEADVVPPSLGMISMSSSSTAGVIGVGQQLTVRFVASEPLGLDSTIAIAGDTNVSLVCDATRIVCTGTYTVSADSPEGPAAMSITIVDVAGNPGMGDFTGITRGSLLPIDTTFPTASLITIASDGANSTLATVGSLISLELRYSEPVHVPNVQLLGRAAQVECTVDECTASVVVTQADPGGLITFDVTEVTDLAGNPGAAMNRTTDGRAVYLQAYVAPPEPEPEPEPEPLPIIFASVRMARLGIIGRAVMLQDILARMQAKSSRADVTPVQYQVQANGSVVWPRSVPGGNASLSVLAAFETALAAASGMPLDRISAAMPQRNMVAFTIEYDSQSMAETLQRDNFLGALLGALESGSAVPDWSWGGAVGGTVVFRTISEFVLSIQTASGDTPAAVEQELTSLAADLERDAGFDDPADGAEPDDEGVPAFAWVATAFPRCENICGPREAVTRSVVCTAADGVQAPDDSACVQIKPADIRVCAPLPEDSPCDDRNDETVDDRCGSTKAGSCAGKIALVSSVTFDIPIFELDDTQTASSDDAGNETARPAVDSSPIARVVKPALATALTAGGMNCTEDDIVVLSISAGSLVVDYRVQVPPVLATPSIRAAAAAAVADPASVGLPVDTMAISVVTTDASGNAITVTSSNTPIVEAFRSYAYVLLAGSCPAAADCSSICGTAALTAPDEYTCHEDGELIDDQEPCVSALGGVPSSSTECCPAADPDACRPAPPPESAPEPEPAVTVPISGGLSEADPSAADLTTVIIALAAAVGGCCLTLCGLGLWGWRRSKRSKAKVGPDTAHRSFVGDASKLEVSSKYNLRTPAMAGGGKDGQGRPLTEELGLGAARGLGNAAGIRSASYAGERLERKDLSGVPALRGLRSASFNPAGAGVRGDGGGGRARRGSGGEDSSASDGGVVLSDSFKRQLQQQTSVGGGSFDNGGGGPPATIQEGREDEDEETPRNQPRGGGGIHADTFNTRLGRFRSFMRDLDENSKEKQTAAEAAAAAAEGETTPRLAVRSASFGELASRIRAGEAAGGAVDGPPGARVSSSLRSGTFAGSIGGGGGGGGGSRRAGAALLQSASFTAELQQRRRAGSGGRRGSFDTADGPDAAGDDDSNRVPPHPLSAGSGMWATPTKAGQEEKDKKAVAAALISSSFNERPGKSGEEVVLGRRGGGVGVGSLRSATFSGRIGATGSRSRSGGGGGGGGSSLLSSSFNERPGKSGAEIQLPIERQRAGAGGSLRSATFSGRVGGGSGGGGLRAISFDDRKAEQGRVVAALLGTDMAAAGSGEEEEEEDGEQQEEEDRREQAWHMEGRSRDDEEDEDESEEYSSSDDEDMSMFRSRGRSRSRSVSRSRSRSRSRSL